MEMGFVHGRTNHFLIHNPAMEGNMKISTFSLQQESSHLSFEKHVEKESITYITPEESENVLVRGGEPQASFTSEASQNIVNQVKISKLAMSRAPVKAIASEMTEEEIAVTDLNMRILQEMIERITGKKLKIFSTSNFDTEPKQLSEGQSEEIPKSITAPEKNEEQIGMIYDFYESHHEYETTEFTSNGVIQTEDGREIAISITLNMSREFYSENSLQVRTGAALKDPLVLNFNGNSVGLTERNFEFDIDADGKSDQIAFTTPDSGFLALDRNGDNQINDGSELFGALTGDGFGELAGFDEDHNGWIDENDAIYDKLRIWMTNGGKQSLVGLGEKGVGAIYLGNVETPFLIKDENNVTEAQVRASGVFINEDGSVGTVQQVDLVA